VNHDQRIRTERKSLAPRLNVVVGQEIAKCLTCGAQGVHDYDSEKPSPGHFVSCPNRNTERGVVAETIGKCSNTHQRFRTTKAGAIAAWNTAQKPDGERKEIYDAELDLKWGEDAPRCGCGLLLPCTCADAKPTGERPATRTPRSHSARQKPDRIVFEPMDAVRFAELHARWLVRERKQYVPATGFGRANRERVDPVVFTKWADRVRKGRAKQRAEVFESKAPEGWAK
jgi:hypothetical protein